jgi:hypothetical protein
MVAASIAVLKFAEMVLFIATSVAPSIGSEEVTVGRMPWSSSFSQPVKRTATSIAAIGIILMTGKKFLNFILYLFMPHESL